MSCSFCFSCPCGFFSSCACIDLYRDDEKKKLHENLKQEIRSLLISSPKTKYGGLTGSLLYFDYKQLNCGKEVPCKLNNRKEIYSFKFDFLRLSRMIFIFRC